ncbi:MAG: hypothetical protein ABIT47_01065 [Candidatus Paceibacterota bacterium]
MAKMAQRTHHAYYVAGDVETGVTSARSFSEQELGQSLENNPDIIILRFGLFSVDDARKLIDSAYRSASGDKGKVIIASMTRVFHEAQNALLKLFEEPPEGVTLILCVPSAGLLLPTLRSRLLSLPVSHSDSSVEQGGETENNVAHEFLESDTKEREKIITKLLDKTKSDKDDVKQAARSEAIGLIEGLLRASYVLSKTTKMDSSDETLDELRTFESDLSAFLPILHERSAPLKLIFEHILLVIPKSLGEG